MKNKTLKVGIIAVLLLALCAIPVFATDYTEEDALVVATKLTTLPDVLYSADSTATEGVTLEPYVDDFTQTVGVKIVLDLPFGHTIYDDPSTDIIDGIRINGETVKSYYYAIDPDVILSDDFGCNVVVKTVYKSDASGDIAKLLDGHFDADVLFSNPILVLQFVYYAISVVMLIASLFVLLFSKKKRVKTAEEITKTIDTKSDILDAKLAEYFDKAIAERILPIFQANTDSTQNVVKALALANSKDKNAPLAILDLLENVSSKDSAVLIENAKQTLQKSKDAANAHKETVMQTLKNIAEASQEELANVTEEKSVF